jgi:hypothetical protein
LNLRAVHFDHDRKRRSGVKVEGRKSIAEEKLPCWSPSHPISNGPYEAVAREAQSGVHPRLARLPIVAPSEHGSRNESGYRCQPAIGIQICAKQTLANGRFNERERFLGLSRFGFSSFGAKLYRRQLILLNFNAGLGLFQRSARILQLTFCGDDEFMMCPLSGLRSHFGKPQSFQGARANRLGTGFSLAGALLHTAEDIGRLIYQIESCCSLVWCQRRGKAQDGLIPSN